MDLGTLISARSDGAFILLHWHFPGFAISSRACGPLPKQRPSFSAPNLSTHFPAWQRYSYEVPDWRFGGTTVTSRHIDAVPAEDRRVQLAGITSTIETAPVKASRVFTPP
jgi:hypothetical protein